MSFLAAELGSKRLELLRQLVPTATMIAALVNPGSANTEAERREVQAAAQAIGQQLTIFDVSSERDIETAFATLVQRGADALFVEWRSPSIWVTNCTPMNLSNCSKPWPRGSSEEKRSVSEKTSCTSA